MFSHEEYAAADRKMNRDDPKRRKVRVEHPPLDAVIDLAHVTASVTLAGYEPAKYMGNGDPAQSFTARYNVRLRNLQEDFTVTFMQGAAFGAPPALSGVLANLVLDMGTFAEYGDDLDSFFSDFGFERPTDALRSLDAMREQTEHLRKMFTAEQLTRLQELVADY